MISALTGLCAGFVWWVLAVSSQGRGFTLQASGALHVLGALMLVWMVTRVARRVCDLRARGLALPRPRADAGAAADAGMRGVLVPLGFLAGVLSGTVNGLYTPDQRLWASAVAALPVALTVWVLGVGLGEVLLRRGWCRDRTRRLELAGAVLVLGGATMGRVGDRSYLQELGTDLVRGVTEPVMGRLLERLPATMAIALGLSALLFLTAFWLTWRMHQVPPEDLPAAAFRAYRPKLDDRLDLGGAGGLGAFDHATRAFMAQWGALGILAFFLMMAGGMRLTMRVGALVQRGELREPYVLMVLVLAMGVLLVVDAPDWVPGAPPSERAVDGRGLPREAARAFGLGAARGLTVFMALVAAVRLGGALGDAGVAVLTLMVMALGAPSLGLATLSLRWRGAPWAGALLFLAGLLGLVFPVLVLELLLGVLLAEFTPLGRAVYLGDWALLAAFGAGAGLVLGTWLPLVYCEEEGREAAGAAAIDG